MSVKRIEFLQHLSSNDCFLNRHGSNHDIYQNSKTKKKTSVPRTLIWIKSYVNRSASNSRFQNLDKYAFVPSKTKSCDITMCLGHSRYILDITT